MAGGGRGRRKRAGKLKARQAALKDSNADYNKDFSDEIAEELTVLAAIFQEDFTLISESPLAEFRINMRPHYFQSGDGEEYVAEDYIAAELHVRCMPGYPQRPPKLQITAKKGLKNDQLRYLRSMLAEQAASIAREGRVMIYNLTEAAQEFLSDQCKGKAVRDEFGGDAGEHSHGSTEEAAWAAAVPSAADLADEDPGSDDTIYLERSLLWGESVVDDIQTASLNGQPDCTRDPALPFREKRFWEKTRKAERSLDNSLRKGRIADVLAVTATALPSHGHKASAQAEETGQDELLPSPKSGGSSSASELLQQVREGLVYRGRGVEEFENVEQSWSSCSSGDADEDHSPAFSGRGSPSPDDSATHLMQKDLVIAYLLRHICSPRGPSPKPLLALASELQNIEVLSPWAKDLVVDQPQLFDKTFRRMFGQVSLLGEGSDPSSTVSSRYVNDFEELSLLGRGGFGHVVLCKNKLDSRKYAMKKIRLRDENSISNDKILREVTTLSGLQHHHVVRYYQAWIESGNGQLDLIANNSTDDSEGSVLQDWTSAGSKYGPKNFGRASTFLYIQMEFCSRTLRDVFDDSYVGPVNKDDPEIWRIFRQLVQGLAHIHGQGILHRDLTPNNIFFDALGDIKIGDFGLAKFTNLEQTDKDPNPADAREPSGANFEGTGRVGTYFYTAPEMELDGLAQIDVKVDIYSLGVVFFEFWYPFTTGMERYSVLNDLKQNGQLPSAWSSEFAQQATLVRWLMAHDPADRPSAAQILRSELLPPKMEDESLNDILRTIQKGEDTSVRDQVLEAVFDPERIAAKAAYIDPDLAKSKRYERDKSLIKVVAAREEHFVEYVKDVFVRHGAQCVESSCFNVVDDPSWRNDVKNHDNRQVANFLDSSGNLLDVRYEPRLSCARWIAADQISSMRIYELSRVYRKSVGDNAPREFLQGNFDIIGGERALAAAEAVKVAMEVVSGFPGQEVRINHQQILRAIWAWTGVQDLQNIQKVAQILAVMGSAPPQSAARKAVWPKVRQQLLQGLRMPEAVVDRLQTVERRLTGSANEVLARLRGALLPSKVTSTAIDEVSNLLRYLRIWQIDKEVLLDALMTPSDGFFDGVFFQVHTARPGNYGNRANVPSACVAVGGSYSRLIARHWAYWASYASYASTPPGAVGLSVAVQSLNEAESVVRREVAASIDVLVCSKGGGGLLAERMEILNDLWTANIKAEYVCSEAPSLTEQYEYANDHGIKCLVIITEAALSLAGTVKVRRLDLKVEEDVAKPDLVKYLNDVASTPLNLRRKASFMRSAN